jgi:uncharacterized protein (TIGR00730 family)
LKLTNTLLSCGSSPGKSPVYLAAARELAHVLHENNIHMVYGGGTVGLMGEVAKTLVSLSGPSAVHGIIPAALVKLEQGGQKPAESEYGRTTIVQDMHTRKRLMASEVEAGAEGSGFVALPGGYGTMEELFEVTTWNQLGIHEKGIVVFNIEGYYDGLIKWVGTAVGEGFVGAECGGVMVEAKSGIEVVEKLREYKVQTGRFKLNWKSEGDGSE